MCLETVDEKTKNGEGYGYKVFVSDYSCHLRFPYYGGRIKYEQWYQDKAKGEVVTLFSTNYPKGYHIFQNAGDAKRWGNKSPNVRKVYYQAVVASGLQKSYPVIVARKIYIMKGKV